MPGETPLTITLRTVTCDAELKIVQEVIPDAIPTEFCYARSQESLTLLAHLVEPHIPEA